MATRTLEWHLNWHDLDEDLIPQGEELISFLSTVVAVWEELPTAGTVLDAITIAVERKYEDMTVAHFLDLDGG